MNSIFSQTCVHDETGYSLEIVSSSSELMSAFTPAFMETDKIVGAQFYYTNPIMYMLVEEFDKRFCARLFGDYYLMGTGDGAKHKLFSGIAAVNSVFLERVGSYASHATELAENLNSYQEKYGLHLVGIDIKSLKVGSEYEGWKDEQPNQEPI